MPEHQLFLGYSAPLAKVGWSDVEERGGGRKALAPDVGWEQEESGGRDACG